MSTTLSQRLRAMRAAFSPEDNAQLVDEFDQCIAQAEAQEAQAGELSDFHYNVLKERMIEEHRKYGDKLRFGHWADIAARKVVSHLRDMGYLRPSQAIGEPDAYMLKREDPLAPSLFTKWEVMRRIELRRNKEEEFIPLYRSPMSSEARDKAIEAGNALKAWIRKNLPHSHTQEGHEAVVVLKAWDQALSALRGE